MIGGFYSYAYLTPFYIKLRNRIVPVLIDQSGLTDLSGNSDVSYEMVLGPAPLVFVPDDDGVVWFVPVQVGSYRIKLTYESSITYYSFVVIYTNKFLTQDDCYTTYLSELIPGVYTQSQETSSPNYVDDYATAGQLAAANLMVQSLQDTGYPETGDISKWQYELTGFNNLYEITNPNTYLLLQFLRNIQANGSLNPYDLTLYISEYIAYRTNYAYYVYVVEHIPTPKNTWVLGVSLLGVNTILGGDSNFYKTLNIYIFQQSNPAIADNIKVEITWFIQKIIRGDLLFTVDYTHSPDDFNLIVERTTYYGDPGLDAYCLQFPLENSTLVALQPPLKAANALVTPYAPAYLESIAIIYPEPAILVSEATTTLYSTSATVFDGTLTINNLTYADVGDENVISTFDWTYSSTATTTSSYMIYTTQISNGFWALPYPATASYFGNTGSVVLNTQAGLLPQTTYNAYLDLYEFEPAVITGVEILNVVATYVSAAGTYTKSLTTGLDFTITPAENAYMDYGMRFTPLNSGITSLLVQYTTAYGTYNAVGNYVVSLSDPQVNINAVFLDATTLRVSFYDQLNDTFTIDFVSEVVATLVDGTIIGSNQSVNGNSTVDISLSSIVGDDYVYVSLYTGNVMPPTGDALAQSVCDVPTLGLSATFTALNVIEVTIDPVVSIESEVVASLPDDTILGYNQTVEGNSPVDITLTELLLPTVTSVNVDLYDGNTIPPTTDPISSTTATPIVLTMESEFTTATNIHVTFNNVIPVNACVVATLLDGAVIGSNTSVSGNSEVDITLSGSLSPSVLSVNVRLYNGVTVPPTTPVILQNNIVPIYVVLTSMTSTFVTDFQNISTSFFDQNGDPFIISESSEIVVKSSTGTILGSNTTLVGNSTVITTLNSPVSFGSQDITVGVWSGTTIPPVGSPILSNTLVIPSTTYTINTVTYADPSYLGYCRPAITLNQTANFPGVVTFTDTSGNLIAQAPLGNINTVTICDYICSFPLNILTIIATVYYGSDISVGTIVTTKTQLVREVTVNGPRYFNTPASNLNGNLVVGYKPFQTLLNINFLGVDVDVTGKSVALSLLDTGSGQGGLITVPPLSGTITGALKGGYIYQYLLLPGNLKSGQTVIYGLSTDYATCLETFTLPS